MGQFSAELNYERRLKRYEEEWEERIIKSENWEEELERYLEEAMERWEEIEGQEEEPKVEAKEYENSSLLMMEGNLSEDEKREGKEYMKEEYEKEERKEKEREAVTSGGLVLLHKPGKENEGIEAVETEDHLRELIEAIEMLAEEGTLQREEKLEDLAEELSKEEKRQEELCREELFEATARKIEKEAESEGPLERLLEGVAEPQEIEERVEKLSKFVEYEKPEEIYEEPMEELEILEEKFEELMGWGESLEGVIEGFERTGKEVREEGVEEPGEELVEKRVEEAIEEKVEEPVEEEVEELVEERTEELVEEANEEEAEEEEIEEEVVKERAEELVKEEVEERTGELVEEIEEEIVGEIERDEEEIEEKEESSEVGGTWEEALSSEGEEIVISRFEMTIPKSGQIHRKRMRLEKGPYLIRVARKEDGKIFEWYKEKGGTGELFIYIPKRLKDKLVGKDVEIAILRYNYSLHFRCKGSNFYFSPRNGLIVDGKEIEVERVEPLSWGTDHGASMRVKLKQKSIKGVEIYFAFFEDGTVSLISGNILDERSYQEATLEVKQNLLIIKHRDRESVVPILVKEWKVGEEYYLNIPVKGRERLRLLQELRKIFGYYNTEELQRKIKEGELVLVAYFDNGRYAVCGTEGLEVNVPKDAEALKYVEIQLLPKFSCLRELSGEEVERIKKASSTTELGNIGRDKVAAVIPGEGIPEITDVKSIYKEVWIRDESDKRIGKVDLVIEIKDGRFMVVEVETTENPDNLAKRFRDGARQLREDYMEPIKRYGLILKDGDKERVIKGIDTYWVFSIYFDIENKVVRMSYDSVSYALPPG
ncbi:MAG: hypothetical protein JTT13_01160 [Candidatus Brockarchaeota archaeon]|nr:hypothetical protein [Candidatus Brockarchaeota archaeon]